MVYRESARTFQDPPILPDLARRFCADGMHELPVINDIIAIVTRHAQANGVRRVLSVQLEVGALCDAEPEWLSRYFAAVSKGTVCGEAVLEVTRVPLGLACRSCGNVEEGMSFREIGSCCPSCGSTDREAVSGSEYRVVSIKAE